MDINWKSIPVDVKNLASAPSVTIDIRSVDLPI